MMRSSMFAVQRRAVASMAEPLLSAQQFKEAPLTSVTPDAQLTTLPNGVRVVSVARASPFVALGVAVEAGSRHETHQSSGAAFALASTFLKSSRTRSSLRVTRELEAVSNDASAEATRDFVLYRATTSREAAGSALSQLVDITAPALRHWEIEEAHEYVDHMATRALTDAALTDDLLHAAAFRGLGAGRPLVPHRHAASVELDQLRSFVLRNFVAPRLIVVASGLDADAAVSIAKAATANVPKGVAAPAPAHLRRRRALPRAPERRHAFFARPLRRGHFARRRRRARLCDRSPQLGGRLAHRRRQRSPRQGLGRHAAQRQRLLHRPRPVGAARFSRRDELAVARHQARRGALGARDARRPARLADAAGREESRRQWAADIVRFAQRRAVPGRVGGARR